MMGDDQRLALGRQIYSYFVNKGLPPQQAAAIAGNMAWEGGGRADLVNRGDNYDHSPRAPHSVGIAQWNDRSPALFDYARQQGIDLGQGDLRDPRYAQWAIGRVPLQTQLDFAWNEMQGPERRAYEGIARSGDINSATANAMSYHRPAGWTWGNPSGGHGYGGRLALANQILGSGGTSYDQTPPVGPDLNYARMAARQQPTEPPPAAPAPLPSRMALGAWAPPYTPPAEPNAPPMATAPTVSPFDAQAFFAEQDRGRYAQGGKVNDMKRFDKGGAAMMEEPGGLANADQARYLRGIIADEPMGLGNPNALLGGLGIGGLYAALTRNSLPLRALGAIIGPLASYYGGKGLYNDYGREGRAYDAKKALRQFEGQDTPLPRVVEQRASDQSKTRPVTIDGKTIQAPENQEPMWDDRLKAWDMKPRQQRGGGGRIASTEPNSGMSSVHDIDDAPGPHAPVSSPESRFMTRALSVGNAAGPHGPLSLDRQRLYDRQRPSDVGSPYFQMPLRADGGGVNFMLDDILKNYMNKVMPPPPIPTYNVPPPPGAGAGGPPQNAASGGAMRGYAEGGVGQNVMDPYAPETEARGSDGQTYQVEPAKQYPFTDFVTDAVPAAAKAAYDYLSPPSPFSENAELTKPSTWFNFKEHLREEPKPVSEFLTSDVPTAALYAAAPFVGKGIAAAGPKIAPYVGPALTGLGIGGLGALIAGDSRVAAETPTAEQPDDGLNPTQRARRDALNARQERREKLTRTERQELQGINKISEDFASKQNEAKIGKGEREATTKLELETANVRKAEAVRDDRLANIRQPYETSKYWSWLAPYQHLVSMAPGFVTGMIMGGKGARADANLAKRWNSSYQRTKTGTPTDRATAKDEVEQFLNTTPALKPISTEKYGPPVIAGGLEGMFAANMPEIHDAFLPSLNQERLAYEEFIKRAPPGRPEVARAEELLKDMPKTTPARDAALEHIFSRNVLARAATGFGEGAAGGALGKTLTLPFGAWESNLPRAESAGVVKATQRAAATKAAKEEAAQRAQRAQKLEERRQRKATQAAQPEPQQTNQKSPEAETPEPPQGSGRPSTPKPEQSSDASAQGSPKKQDFSINENAERANQARQEAEKAFDSLKKKPNGSTEGDGFAAGGTASKHHSVYQPRDVIGKFAGGPVYPKAPSATKVPTVKPPAAPKAPKAPGLDLGTALKTAKKYATGGPVRGYQTRGAVLPDDWRTAAPYERETPMPSGPPMAGTTTAPPSLHEMQHSLQPGLLGPAMGEGLMRWRQAPKPYATLQRQPPSNPQRMEDWIGFAQGGMAQQHGELATKSGELKSDVPGRTDHIPLTVKTGAYIIPADIVSGIGEGNTAAGARQLDLIFKTTGKGAGSSGSKRPQAAAGGGVPLPEPIVPTVPIMAAGGEYHVQPEDVARIGSGDVNQGHRILDHFVKQARKKHIQTLAGLPGPQK